MEKLRLYAIISGRVQGVFFRVNTRNKAYELGLTGWVKNNYDGDVEVVCEGPKENIDRMLEWLKKGPNYAKVIKVEHFFDVKEEGFEDFKIVH
ncbi:MAG: acylphosphatase [Promethearchaeota archaeon]